MTERRFGLLVIGDEILSGRKQDVHMSAVISLLGQYQQELSWARYVGDDWDALLSVLKDSFATQDIVFVTGGIGATPDDRTRQAAAAALGLEIEPHQEGIEILKDVFSGDRWSEEEWPNRMQMACFPKGSQLIPNSYNRVSGFSIQEHYFVPGFPKMAHPMLEWVMEHYYSDLPSNRVQEIHYRVKGTHESQITPLLEQIESQFPEAKTVCLPSNQERGVMEVGVKGRQRLDEAAEYLLKGLQGYTQDVERL